MSGKKVYILFNATNEEVDPVVFDSEGKLAHAIEEMLDEYSLKTENTFTNLSELNDVFGTDYRTHEVEVE